MEKLTFDEFKKLEHGKVFATGILPNSSEGILVTNNGGKLRWVAVKEGIEDWAVYFYWAKDSSIDFVKNHGNKVTTEEYIRRCVPCSNEVFDLYRY